MNNRYAKIEEKEEEIERLRLDIKNDKKKVINLESKKDVLGILYEYLTVPLCSVSIAISALYSGPIIYLLPSFMSLVAAGTITSKYFLNNKIEKINDLIKKKKENRHAHYRQREDMYQKIFDDLKDDKRDVLGYSKQVKKVKDLCFEINKKIEPYRIRRDKLQKRHDILLNIFEYILAPISAIAIPLVCGLFNLSNGLQIGMAAISSVTILTCLITKRVMDNKLDELNQTIDELKDDRTVKYVTRDLKFKECLSYLKSLEEHQKSNLNRVKEPVKDIKLLRRR